jgi:hypothetical protein
MEPALKEDDVMLKGYFFGLGLTVLASLAATACSSAPSDKHNAGGGAGTGAQTDDGSIGSSCGSCEQGLSCAASAPGGYCTKACGGEADCGGGAHCIQLQSGTACMRSCTSDADCRQGYSCQGDAAVRICYPGGAGGSGGAGGAGGSMGGCIDMQTLTAGYWQRNGNNGATISQIQFNADGTASMEISNGAGGDAWYSGQWTLSCPNLDVTFSDGADPIHFVVQNGSLNDGSSPWSECNGKCF